MIKEAVVEDVLFEEVFIDGIGAADLGADDGLKGDLIDESGQAFSQVKDQLDGVIGEELFGSFGPLDVETDIVASIFDGKASEVVCEDDALSEGFVLGLFETYGELLRP